MRYKCIVCLYEFEYTGDNPYCPSCDNGCLDIIEEGFTTSGEEIEYHHIHPKFMDNKNGKGKLCPLTKTNHSIIHGLIMKWLWEEFNDRDKRNAVRNIIKKSEEFIGGKE